MVSHADSLTLVACIRSPYQAMRLCTTKQQRSLDYYVLQRAPVMTLCFCYHLDSAVALLSRHCRFYYIPCDVYFVPSSILPSAVRIRDIGRQAALPQLASLEGIRNLELRFGERGASRLLEDEPLQRRNTIAHQKSSSSLHRRRASSNGQRHIWLRHFYPQPSPATQPSTETCLPLVCHPSGHRGIPQAAGSLSQDTNHPPSQEGSESTCICAHLTARRLPTVI